jgi:hypothetical protein
MNPTLRLFHGGVPNLHPGDLIVPGHSRNHHDGCPWCEARARGEAHLGMDALAEEGRVYCTTSRLYAKHYASLWGRGDLYGVEAVEWAVSSTEDTIESFKAPALQVVSVLERAVLLTPSERRRLYREWTAADLLAADAHDRAAVSA